MYFISSLIVIAGIILIIYMVELSAKIKQLTREISNCNKNLRSKIPTIREIFKLCYEYLEIWKKDTLEKTNASANLAGEILVYYIFHNVFKKYYSEIYSGYSIAKLFF